MIGHQAVGMADPMVASHHPGQRIEKQLAVGVGKKHFLARVAAARQMIDRPGNSNRRGRAIAPTFLSNEMCYCKT
jgi:hypothetical protein